MLNVLWDDRPRLLNLDWRLGITQPVIREF